MRICILTVCWLLAMPLYAQFTDDFSDSNFTINPVWIGDSTLFEVDPALMLHLNASSNSGKACLAVSNNSIQNGEWEFLVRMNFNPSGSNYTKIYLVSNQQNCKNSLNGYFVKLGGSDDEVSLYVQTGIVETKIIDGKDNRLDMNQVNVRVKVSRDASGNWVLHSDSAGGFNFTSEGNVFDNTHYYSKWFGIICNYTSTRSDKFYFDDFIVSGVGYTDTVLPFVSEITNIHSSGITIVFSEEITKSSAEITTHFYVDHGVGNPISALIDTNNTKKIDLLFSDKLVSGTKYNITVKSIEDMFSNSMTPSTHEFSYYTPLQNDIIITEIFADPLPQIGLPEYEFVELYNRTPFPISLNGWIFSDLSSNTYLPYTVINPDSFIILCSTEALNDYIHFGKTIGVSNWPSLNNAGDQLMLKDDSGYLISQVHYSDHWYRSEIKENGGWTLEMIDPGNPCGGSNNWTGSQNMIGGTPGTLNSVYTSNPDNNPPKLVRAFAMDSLHIKLIFDEPINRLSADDLNHYQINNGIGQPDSAEVQEKNCHNIEIVLQTPIRHKKIYTIYVNTLSDCAGNRIRYNNSAKFGLPEEVKWNDIVINEILFNPKPFGFDFVELYNRSDKILNLMDLYIANLNVSDSLNQVQMIIDEGYLTFPQQYTVLTEDVKSIKETYWAADEQSLLELDDMPGFPDKSGSAVIVDKWGKRIDHFKYNENMHFPLIDRKDGVSLEKINYDIPSSDTNNWHSAASTVDFATPGYQNSQFSKWNTFLYDFVVEPEVFSPDNDGYHDYLKIHYNFEKSGYMVNLSIYDLHGRLTKIIANNDLLGTTGTYIWDGITNTGEKANMGIYIICIEIFDMDGNSIKKKKTCVLGGYF